MLAYKFVWFVSSRTKLLVLVIQKCNQKIKSKNESIAITQHEKNLFQITNLDSTRHLKVAVYQFYEY